MSSTQRTRYTAALAAVGAGALTFGGSVLPAFAESPGGDATLVEAILAEPLATGGEVLDALNNDQLDLVAERAGLKTSEVKSLLEDDLAGVSPGGHFFYKDKWEVPAVAFEGVTKGNVPGSPADGSRPGAPVTIYLDFDGETVANTLWNFEEGMDGSPIEASPASAADEAFQQRVWELVAEDYSGFNVNVTTTLPSDDALLKSSPDDTEYGSHVVITDTYDETMPFVAGSGGIAYLGGTGAGVLSPAWVFTTGLGGGDPAAASPKTVADAASHEVGHNFGLSHDGIGEEEYYAPASGLWGPIMGAPYSVPLTQWSNGDYAGATNTEDDFAVMTDHAAGINFPVLTTGGGELYTGAYCTSGDPENPQAGDEFWVANADNTCEPRGEALTLERIDYTDRGDFKKDDVGNDAGSATALNNTDGSFGYQGFVGQTADVDVFSLVTNGGPFTADVAPSENGANLDAKLTLLDADSNVVAEDNPETAADSEEVASGLGASLSQDLEAGAYYLIVEGLGQGDGGSSTPEQASGYSDYGSLGFYTLSGEAAPFEAEPVTITAPEDGAEVARNDLEVTGTAEPGASVALTANGEAAAEATAGDDGAWSATIERVPYGQATIEAQQTVGTIVVPEKASVTVTVPVDAPAITKPEDGQTANTPRPTFAGTGIPGAVVTVTILPGEVTGTAEVNTDGNWEFVPEADLANGDYSVTATQTVNEVTSDPSAEIKFAIDIDSSGDAGGNEDGGPDLPDTGSSSLGLIGLAAGLVLLGGGAAWYARTRRSAA